MKQKVLTFLALSFLLGVIASLASLVLPNQFTATGTLFIARKAQETSEDFFTYEGSYAQQNASSYASAFLSLLQSPSNIEQAQTGLDTKKVLRLIKAKKEGNQVIIFSVKASSAKQAKEMWAKIVNSAITTHKDSLEKFDPQLSILIIPTSPVILKTYPSWEKIFLMTCTSSFCALFLSFYALKYLKEENDN